MKKKFEYQERRGLPGGPNEMFTYTTGVFSTDTFSTEGYKRNSPDVNNPYNIIPSGNITMKDVDFPVHGVDNLGNEQMMMPGNDYQFPGDMVFETPMYKKGGGLLTKTMKCNSCGWSWKAADGGNDVTTCHKCGGEALPKAQDGVENIPTTQDSLALPGPSGSITTQRGDGNKKIIYVSNENDPEYLKYVAHNKLYRKLKDHNRAAQKRNAQYNVKIANEYIPLYTSWLESWNESDEEFIRIQKDIEKLKGVLAVNGIDPNYLTDSKYSLDNRDGYNISDEDQASWDKAKELGLSVKWRSAGTDGIYFNPIVKRPQQIYIVDPSKVEKEIAPEQVVIPEAPIQTQEVQQNRKDQVQYRKVLTGYKINPRTGKREPVYEEQGYRARGSKIGENTTTQNNFKYGGIPKAQFGIEDLTIYKNYLEGVYNNTDDEEIGQKIYDKLNRVYYRQAKENNMSAPNYIMTNVIR